jgi:hypothetical protein
MGLLQAILDGKDMEVERERAAAAGKVAEARKILRLLLSKQFPALASLTEIDMISNADTLESIIESVLAATSAERIRAAIIAAAQPN